MLVGTSKRTKGQTHANHISHLLVLVSRKSHAFFFFSSFFFVLVDFFVFPNRSAVSGSAAEFPILATSFFKSANQQTPHMSASLQRASSVGGSLIARDTGPERTAKV